MVTQLETEQKELVTLCLILCNYKVQIYHSVLDLERAEL